MLEKHAKAGSPHARIAIYLEVCMGTSAQDYVICQRLYRSGFRLDMTSDRVAGKISARHGPPSRQSASLTATKLLFQLVSLDGHAVVNPFEQFSDLVLDLNAFALNPSLNLILVSEFIEDTWPP
jgi:hypothetical protein